MVLRCSVLRVLTIGLLMGAAPGCERGAPKPAGKPGAPHVPPATTKAAIPPAPMPTGPLPPATFADDAAVVRALKSGGYVIVIRHTKTDPAQNDASPGDFSDCASQRNLTEEGRADAAAMGKAFESLKIPVADVLSSPFCRCKETAQLAFGRVTINAGATGSDQGSIAARKVLLATSPPAGKNTVIVSHRDAMAAATGLELDDFVEGATLLVIPKGGAESAIVKTIVFEDWARLVGAAGQMK